MKELWGLPTKEFCIRHNQKWTTERLISLMKCRYTNITFGTSSINRSGIFLASSSNSMDSAYIPETNGHNGAQQLSSGHTASPPVPLYPTWPETYTMTATRTLVLVTGIFRAMVLLFTTSMDTTWRHSSLHPHLVPTSTTRRHQHKVKLVADYSSQLR